MAGAATPSPALPFPFVDEANDENGEKNHHRHEAEHPDVLQGDGPGKQEGDFQIEQNEQDRDQVVADVELHPCVFEGLESALIRRELGGVRPVDTDQACGNLADDGEHGAEPKADKDEEQDWKVVGQHRFLLTAHWPH